MTAMVDVLHPSYQAEELLKNQGREHPVENLSYLCKICSKRFVSGRALGGHMRAHVPLSMPAYKRPRVSDDKSMDEKVDEEGLDGNGSNLLYALQSWRFADWDDSFLLGQGLDSNPIDSSLNCDLCGKEFSSWKGLFGHKKCHCETHQDSGDCQLEESHKHETHDEEEQGSETDAEIDHPRGNSRKFDKWMKGKGFKRPRYALQLNPCKQFVSETNNEEEDMAMCLVMLASGVNTAETPQFQVGAADPESGDLKLPNKGSQLPKSIKKKPKYKKIDGDTNINADEAKKGRYKCTTCSKVFLSYQALGGHRASHNKVKGGFTQIEDQNLKSLEEEITNEQLNTGLDSQLFGNFHKPSPKERTKDSCVKARDETGTVEPAVFSGKKTLRVHGCSICHRVFASGQALGGHKRCHLGSTGASDTSTTSSSNKETPMQQQMPARIEMLDLNLPAPVDDDCDAGNLNNLGNNAVDSDGASYAQTHSRPYLLSLLMGNHQKEGGLFLYDTDSHVSRDDEADSKVGNDIGLDSKLGLGKDIGFCKGFNLEFPVRAQSWLQL